MTLLQFIWMLLSSVGIICILFLLLMFSGFWDERPIDVSKGNYLTETASPGSPSQSGQGTKLKAQLPVGETGTSAP